MAEKRHEVSQGLDLRRLADRRQGDYGPPCGWRERRRNVERRMPIVREDEITQTEWFRRMATFLSQRKAERMAIEKAFAALEEGNRVE